MCFQIGMDSILYSLYRFLYTAIESEKKVLFFSSIAADFLNQQFCCFPRPSLVNFFLFTLKKYFLIYSYF